MKTKRTRLTGLLALLTVLALGLAACGSDENKTDAKSSGNSSETTQAASGGATDCASGTLTGAGSTFVQNIEQQWAKDFQAACSGATISYQGVGSGAGIQQFTAGTVDFGATDAVMKPEEEQAAAAKGGAVLHIPWSAGGIAIEYNLDGVDLQLSAETLAGIFAGKITKWNDAALAKDNPDAKLPSAGIQVVHRSDGSGTTAALTSYLDATAKSVWTVGAGKDVPWPTGQGAKGSDGVTALVKQTQGSIGYAEVSFAQQNSLGIAKIKNAAGKFVGPTGEAVAAALAGVEVPADLKIEPDYAVDDPAAYPISTPTWVVVFAKPADAAKGKLLKAFLTYALSTGQDAAGDLFYAPLPSALAEKAQAAVDSIQA